MPPPTSASEIALVPIGDVDRELLDYLAFTLSDTFRTRCSELPLKIEAREAYNQTRRQYHSTQLLRQLHDLREADGGKIIGVTELDLFIPIFTFVFGEAQVGGSCAVMSTHRLHQEFYGLPGDRELWLTRAEKEATHELGHAFGLTHCRSFDCVMRFSNSVENVDVRPSEFCGVCSMNLQTKIDSSMAA